VVERRGCFNIQFKFLLVLLMQKLTPLLKWIRLSFENGLVVGTPDPHHKLHEYMDGDDVGWPSLSRFGWETKPIWAHFIVILFI
jgi:hypothetical protein